MTTQDNITIPLALLEQLVVALDKSIKFANAIGIQNWNTVAMACHDAITALRTALAQPSDVEAAVLAERNKWRKYLLDNFGLEME